jgi:hypothetical protein
MDLELCYAILLIIMGLIFSITGIVKIGYAIFGRKYRR